MARPDTWLGKHRDVPIVPTCYVPAGTAGSANDFEHTLFALPILAQGATSGSVSELPVNSQNVRFVLLTPEANLTGAATNNFTFNVWQKRNGAILVNTTQLQVSTTSSTTITAGNGVVVTPAAMTNIVVGSVLYFSGGTGTAEYVTVTATTGSTFTANFVNGHSSSYTIVNGVIAGGGVVVSATSMTNIYVGSQLSISGGTGTAETITVSAVTPSTFTATFANSHAGAYTITSAPLATVAYATTSSSTTITAGVNVVTPASMASIYIGSQLNFSGGTGSAETVVVTAVTSTTFTATFVNGHSGGYAIAISELALVPHQLNVIVNSAQALLPGDIVTLARVSSNSTGLASPALHAELDLVPAGIGR